MPNLCLAGKAQVSYFEWEKTNKLKCDLLGKFSGEKMNELWILVFTMKKCFVGQKNSTFQLQRPWKKNIAYSNVIGRMLTASAS